MENNQSVKAEKSRKICDVCNKVGTSGIFESLVNRYAGFAGLIKLCTAAAFVFFAALFFVPMNTRASNPSNPDPVSTGTTYELILKDNRLTYGGTPVTHNNNTEITDGNVKDTDVLIDTKDVTQAEPLKLRFCAGDTIRIVHAGTSAIKSIKVDSKGTNVDATGLEITGSGSLTVTDTIGKKTGPAPNLTIKRDAAELLKLTVQNGISVRDLTAEGVTLTVSKSGNAMPKAVDAANAVIKDSTVTATATGSAGAGIHCSQTCRISGSSVVKAECSDGRGIGIAESLEICDNADVEANGINGIDRGGGVGVVSLNLSGGTLRATGTGGFNGMVPGKGIYMCSVTVNGGTLTAAGDINGTSKDKGAIFGNKPVTVTGGTVIANCAGCENAINPPPDINPASGAGAVVFDNGNGTIGGTVTIPAGDSLNVENGKTLTLMDGTTLMIEAGGALTIGENGSLTVPQGATLIAEENAVLTVNGTGAIYNAGGTINLNNSSIPVSVSTYYIVRYDCNGGNGTIPDQAGWIGQAFRLTKNTFRRTGYRFGGWGVFDGNQQQIHSYQDEETVQDIGGDGDIVTLKALWMANTYMVDFRRNHEDASGTGTMESQDRYYDDGAPLTKNRFQRPGYAFAGWNTAENGKGDSYKDGATDTLTSGNNQTVILYAIWEPIPKTDTGAQPPAQPEKPASSDTGSSVSVPSQPVVPEQKNGWEIGAEGNDYWYENGVRAGTEEDPNCVSAGGISRGREIQDPETGTWYWLDVDADGKKATDKWVMIPYFHQNRTAENSAHDEAREDTGSVFGKWVYYGDDGRMLKGWQSGIPTGNDPASGKTATYYFDPATGAVARGVCSIEENGVRKLHRFDPVTGVYLGEVDPAAYGAGADDGDAQQGDGGSSRETGKQRCLWDYWYENGILQGVQGTPWTEDDVYRGKEIYDPQTDAWYWLDECNGGRKAVGKDVYHPYCFSDEDPGSTKGKWVRYDEDGHMVKGWDEDETGRCYFDLITGAMYKGTHEIDGVVYEFDEVTGRVKE